MGDQEKAEKADARTREKGIRPVERLKRKVEAQKAVGKLLNEEKPKPTPKSDK